MHKILLVTTFLVFVATPTFADIVNGHQSGTGFGTALISSTAGNPFAQSFTATVDEPRLAAASFMWGDTARTYLTLKLDVLHGTSFLDPVVGSATASTPQSITLGDWFNFAFNPPISLTLGEVYMLRFKQVSGTGRFVEVPDTYAGGSLYFNKPGPIDPNNPGQALPN